jgi:kynurenine formamidase
VNTSAGTAYARADYVSKGCGMGREATLYLLERGVRITGTDGWSWDAPFIHTREKYLATRDASLIWEGHKAGREIGYCHIEKLHNLESLPAKGFVVSCFPVKVRRGSAGWTRAVAILDSAT